MTTEAPKMNDPIMLVRIPQSQLAAMQAAGQAYLRDPRNANSPIRAEIEAGIETLDQPYSAEVTP